MRKSVSDICLRLGSGWMAIIVSLTIATQPLFAKPRDESIEKQIARVEMGLLPPVLIDGETPKTVSLLARMAELHVPAVSIAVVHEGKIAWARGFGVVKLGGPPVTLHTLFQAASISKPITALAVLHLAQIGKLSLDTDVNEYLKSWKLPSNQFTQQHPVTLRELLTHTAGVTVHGFPGYAKDQQLPTLVQILNGVAPSNSPPIRVDTKPGSIWRYSGGGYVIIQQLLEDVTGRQFYELMNDIVLAPIGMKESTFEQPLPTGRMKDIAIPYRGNGTPVKGGPHVYPERAPAGLWTTPSDLARYIIEVQHAVAGKSKILTAAMANEMLTPTLNYQGLGPRVAGTSPRRYFQHTGANEGYRCLLVGYEDGNGLVIMTNSDNGSMLYAELVRTVAYEYDWPEFQPEVHQVTKLEPERFDLLAGTYQLAPDFVVTFSRDEDHLFAQVSGLGRVEIFPEGERDFFAKSTNIAFAFDVDAQGHGKAVTFRQNDRVLHGMRLDDEKAKTIQQESSRSDSRAGR
jgi:CubicO group peptidase (beta-lactamase class C family)